MNRVWILQPWSWAAFNYTDWFSSPAVRWAASFNSSRTETSQTQPRHYAPGKGGYHKNTGVNSSGMLMLLSTHSLVTQSITRLEQRRCAAPRQRRSCWLVFLVTRETQKWLLSDADGAAACRKRLHLWSLGAHLYSQKVSSFMPCDSTSGWRSSFSFTAHEINKRCFTFTHSLLDKCCIPGNTKT